MGVTFKDVADLAGVSTQTVSRVTNGSSSVAEETKKKVLAAIDELGYVPNKGAQLLSRAKAMAIGLITLDIGLHGVTLIANGIRKRAQEEGYGTSLSVVSVPSFDTTVNAVRELKSQKIENIIVNLQLDSNDAESLIKQFPDVHFVFIDVPLDAKVNSVCATHFDGASQAAALMLKHGRNRLVLITGPDDSNASKQRLKGWEEQIRQSQARVVEKLEGNWQAESGYLHTQKVLASGDSFDGVLVSNDQMALGVLRALDEHGIKVPQQVAVIGFDDTEDSAYFTPPLTTVRQDFAQLGQQAVDFVLDETLKGEIRQVSLTTELIERKSTIQKQDSGYDKKEIQGLLNQINQLLP